MFTNEPRLFVIATKREEKKKQATVSRPLSFHRFPEILLYFYRVNVSLPPRVNTHNASRHGRPRFEPFAKVKASSTDTETPVDVFEETRANERSNFFDFMPAVIFVITVNDGKFFQIKSVGEARISIGICKKIRIGKNLLTQALEIIDNKNSVIL